MSWTQLSENFWASPQISEAEVSKAKEEGFEVIVCNRPDGESDDQPTHDMIQRAADESGLEYVYLPMKDLNFTADQVSALKDVLATDRKVLAYCRSGRRSSVLFEAALS